jgi:hypothetical protein
VNAIESEDWEEVQRQCELNPERAREWHVGKTYFQGQDTLVLPLQQALVAHDPSIGAICALVQACPASLFVGESSYRRLPLHLAVLNPGASVDIIKLLLDFAPETAMECDDLGRLALHYACGADSIIDIVKVLFDASPLSVSIRDVHGWLPIHVAFRNGASFQTIRLLLDAYPKSIVAETANGNTPLDMIICQNVLGGNPIQL